MYYSTELYHHGVKGMKWGVRKYQNADGTLTAAGKKRYAVGEDGRKDKYNFVDRYRASRRYEKQARKERVSNFKKEFKQGHIGKATSNILGQRALATMSKANRDYYNELSAHSKTKLGAQLNKTRSKNAEERRKYHEKVAKDTVGERIVRTQFFDSDAFNMPYHRLSGRTTTNGKRAVDLILTGGTIGLAKDIAYLHAQKKKNSN